MMFIFAHKQYPQIWRIGEPPCNIRSSDVFEIKVDNEELNMLRKHIHRIPYSNNDHECYYGDMAKYISKALGATS